VRERLRSLGVSSATKKHSRGRRRACFLIPEKVKMNGKTPDGGVLRNRRWSGPKK